MIDVLNVSDRCHSLSVSFETPLRLVNSYLMTICNCSGYHLTSSVEYDFNKLCDTNNFLKKQALSMFSPTVERVD